MVDEQNTGKTKKEQFFLFKVKGFRSIIYHIVECCLFKEFIGIN